MNTGNNISSRAKVISNKPLALEDMKEIVSWLYGLNKKNLKVEEVIDACGISKPTLNLIKTGEHFLWKNLDAEGIEFLPSKIAKGARGGVGYLRKLRERQLERKRKYNLLTSDKFIEKFTSIQVSYFTDRTKNIADHKKQLVKDLVKLESEWLTCAEAEKLEVAKKLNDKQEWKRDRRMLLTLGLFGTKCPVRKSITDRALDKVNKKKAKAKKKRHEEAELNRLSSLLANRR